jgi:thiol-disulfide isomerase/thioredoxin
MKTIEYRTQLPNEFPDGEWKNEYDKKQWLDKRTGLPCLVVRSPVGALCGYVGVTKSHPFFEKNYDDVPNLPVHWGLTFSDKCCGIPDNLEEVSDYLRPKVEEHGPYAFMVCHKVEDGEDENVWWFGFDCAHCDDVMPSMVAMMQKSGREFGITRYGTYKNVRFVESSVQTLALSLKKWEIALKHQSKRLLYRKMRFPYQQTA